MVNVAGSLKLQQYMNNQTIEPEDMEFLETTNFRNLLLKSEFDNIKAQVERYNTLKNNVDNNSGDIALQSDEMKNLAANIFYETGRDANTIQLSSLDTVSRLDKVLVNSNITSKNDLFVKPIYDEWDESSDYIKVEVVDRGEPYKYGIQTGAKMAITNSGKIIVTKKSLYSR